MFWSSVTIANPGGDHALEKLLCLCLFPSHGGETALSRVIALYIYNDFLKQSFSQHIFEDNLVCRRHRCFQDRLTI